MIEGDDDRERGRENELRGRETEGKRERGGETLKHIFSVPSEIVASLLKMPEMEFWALISVLHYF